MSKKKKSKKANGHAPDTMMVNGPAFMTALERLHWYHGELLGNLEVAQEYEDPEWIQDLVTQIEYIQAIYEGFVNAIDGEDEKSSAPSGTMLN